MPYETKWVSPEIACQHKNVTVFHAYKNDEIDQRLSYWYRLDELENDDEFDIRQLDVPANMNLDTDDGRYNALVWAIDNGLLKNNPEGSHENRRKGNETVTSQA